MWCRQCQQDVPVLRGSVGGPACPRCRTSLAPNAEGGVELASFDPPPAPRVTRIQPWVLEADAFELRRLERKLRPCLRHDPACATPALELAEPAIEEEPVVELEHTEHADHFGGADTEPITERALRGGAASVAADSGFLAMIAGAATMAAQNEGLIAAEFWRWGVIGTGIGGAVFALGILRLATRAWRQGRALEAEIDALRAELAEACHWRPASVEAGTRSATLTGDTPVAYSRPRGQSPFTPRTAQKGTVPGVRSRVV